MNTKFKYFHWAIPKPDQSLYGLYDVFDNHLFLLSYDYDTIWELKKLVKSKIILDIVDFSEQIDVVQDKIDNSVVENWGLEFPPYQLFRDLRTLAPEFQNKELYKNHNIINDCKISQTNVVMDNFKIDLQQQLFFFHYCLFQAKHNHKSGTIMSEYLLSIAELSESYIDAENMFLESITNKKDAEFLLHFLSEEKLIYE